MVDEDETVEQVYAEAMETTGVFPSRQTYAKRYLAAHKRELAAKDEERLTVAANYERVIEVKDRIIEAKDRVIDAKVAGITELKRCLRSAARWILTHDIYKNMGQEILDEAKKLLDDDGEFLQPKDN